VEGREGGRQVGRKEGRKGVREGKMREGDKYSKRER